MIEDGEICRGEFNPMVQTYWLLTGVIAPTVTIIGIPLLLFSIPIGLLITGRNLRAMECLLTERTLKVKKGVLVKVEKTIPLEKITDMGMVQGPIMRALGLHALTVETAGQSGSGALVALTGIVDAPSFREKVLRQRDLRQYPETPVKLRSGEGFNGVGSANESVLTEIRDVLLRIEASLDSTAKGMESKKK